MARVGEAAVPLDAREVTIRNEESNWGNFVVDQMRGAFGKHKHPRFDTYTVQARFALAAIYDLAASDVTVGDASP